MIFCLSDSMPPLKEDSASEKSRLPSHFPRALAYYHRAAASLALIEVRNLRRIAELKSARRIGKNSKEEHQHSATLETLKNTSMQD